MGQQALRLLRIADPAAVEHVPVCGVCGEAWPCREERYRKSLALRVWHRQFECWACGKPAKSRSSFYAMLPSGSTFTTWCGPAKYRRCHEIGEMFHEADRRARELRLIASEPQR